MRDIKRLIGVVICALCFIGLYILSDHYAEEALGKYAYEIDTCYSGLPANGSLSIDDLSVEDQVHTYVQLQGDHKIHLAFVGDITFEQDQLDRCYNEKSGTFDFSNSFRYIQKYLKAADYTFGNLEAVMAGPDERYEDYFDQYGTSGFLYNAPESAAGAMKSAGISMLQIANEHSGDFGNAGILSTMNYLHEADIQTVGVQRSNADKDYKLISVNGLSIGVTAFTSDINVPIEEKDSAIINTLDNYNTDKINKLTNSIKNIKQDGASLAIVMVYAGSADQTEPDSNQTALFDACFEAGADIVIGRRPYALQPLEIREVTASDGSVKKGIAIYSLGTFLGSEYYNGLGINNDIGTILDVMIEVDENKRAEIKGIRFEPTCIVYTNDDIFVLPAGEVKQNPEKYSEILDDNGMSRINEAYDHVIPGLNTDEKYSGKYFDGFYQINF